MLIPTPTQLFFSKNDATDPRLGDLVAQLNPQQHLLQQLTHHDFTILGYPDDEGIKNNGGRPGAHLAPNLIRQFLYKMTPDSRFFNPKMKIYDLGDLNIHIYNLHQRHQQVRELANKLYLNKNKIISFGGGHDYGFPDAAAFVDYYKDKHEQKPIVLNFDAHMDVRPIKNNIINSGTPFYRLYEEHPNDFHLIEIGIQPQCNSQFHIDWAKLKGAEVVYLEDIETFGWSYLWEQTELKNSKNARPLFISFDIDAIKSSEAGGCSQSWITGLAFNEVLRFLDLIYEDFFVPSIGIYEVAPPYDRDFQTVKAAALLAHHFMMNNY